MEGKSCVCGKGEGRGEKGIAQRRTVRLRLPERTPACAAEPWVEKKRGVDISWESSDIERRDVKEKPVRASLFLQNIK